MGAIVYTIERQKELYVKAQTLLPEIGYSPKFFFGDGYKGLPTYGPFDRIIVTAGASSIPEDLKTQLKIEGKMVIPVGKTNRQDMVLITRVAEDEFKTEKHGSFVFVPLLKGTVNN